VITNARADTTVTSIESIQSLLISGVNINFDENGLYETPLALGVELDILLKAEIPRVFEIQDNDVIQMI